MMTLTMGGLFVLKFQSESKRTEYAMQLSRLIDQTTFDGSMGWNARQQNYYDALAILAEAEEKKVDVEKLISLATEQIEVAPVYRAVLADCLMKNYKIAQEFQLLTAENFDRLKLGEGMKIGGGGYVGEMAVMSNLVPHTYSPELEMRFANLLIKPESVLRRYPDAVAEDAIILMSACRSAEMMTETSYARAMRAMQRSGRS